jgi:hypothetical protein
MRVATKLRACAAAFSILLASAPSVAAGHMTDFDINKLDNWSDALAVCDVTRFLLTDLDLNADVLMVGGHGNTYVALYRPLFSPPTNFFSDAMHEAFDNLRKTGLVTPEAYGSARTHYATVMIEAYRTATIADKRYMADQMDLCYHLVARAGVKLNRNK